MATGRKLTTEEFIKRSMVIHEGRYSYESSKYISLEDGIEITCSIHGSFIKIASYHLAGCGCPKCHLIEKSKQKTKTFIEKASQIHGDRFDYSLVEFVRCDIPVFIRCSIHGTFQQAPTGHLKGYGGCLTCSKIELGKFNTLTQEQFMEDVLKAHGNLYCYDKTLYKGADETVTVGCPVHGDFEIRAAMLKVGRGCPKCSREIVVNRQKTSINEFIRRAIEIHGDKYDYSLLSFQKLRSPVSIICPIHNVFEITGEDHIYFDKGCPLCDGGKKISRGERKIMDILDKYGISFEFQKRLVGCVNPRTNRTLAFDFYIEGLNLAIEFDGPQHFESIDFWGGDVGLESSQYRDSVKNEYCEREGIKLLRIFYKDDILKSLIDNGVIDGSKN